MTPDQTPPVAPPPTPAPLGTEAIVVEIDALLEGVAVYKEASADGKIDLNDAGLLLQLVPFIGPAIAGGGQVLPEFKDLTTPEAEALVAHVMSKLALDNPKAQAVAEAALEFAASGFKLFKAVSA